jgi:hypothetical protein
MSTEVKLYDMSTALKVYLRTSQLKASRRKDYDSNLGVSITVDTLKKYSARFPMDGVQTKIIDGKDGKELFCLCTERGTVDLSLLKRKHKHFAPLHKFLWRCLEQVDLPEHNLSSEHGFDWFRFFLSQRNRTDAIQSFLTVDLFSGRIHTPVSSLYREYRKLLTLCGEQTTSLDVAQMQPCLLAAHLTINVGANSFSDAIDRGEDVYTLLQTKAGLATRDEAKKKFFEIAFGKPSDKLAKLFDGEAWINWINEYKTAHDTRNPHGVEKPHSNLAWLLQSTEVLIMSEIWETLARINIPFLTVHDEIICRSKDAERVEEVMSKILSEKLNSFKINLK